MKIIKDLVEKIKDFFRKVFLKEKDYYLEDQNNDYLKKEEKIKQIAGEYIVDENDPRLEEEFYFDTKKDINKENYESEKKRIIELYNLVKKGIINIKNVDDCDLMQLVLLANEERKLKNM